MKSVGCLLGVAGGMVPVVIAAAGTTEISLVGQSRVWSAGGGGLLIQTSRA